jgi:hypothetical protein
MAKITKQNTTKAIDGYRVRERFPDSPVLDLDRSRRGRCLHFGATILKADFHYYADEGWCVDALVKIGIVKSPYTLVLTLDQAREADIIEKV